MKEYVLDANALLRFFNIASSAGGEKVRQLIVQAQRGEARLFISVVNLGEVFYVMLRHVGETRAREYLQVVRRTVSIVEADWQQVEQAGMLKHRYRLAYADSFAAGLALQKRGTLVSADPAFESLGKILKWLRLPNSASGKKAVLGS